MDELEQFYTNVIIGDWPPERFTEFKDLTDKEKVKLKNTFSFSGFMFNKAINNFKAEFKKGLLKIALKMKIDITKEDVQNIIIGTVFGLLLCGIFISLIFN